MDLFAQLTNSKKCSKAIELLRTKYSVTSVWVFIKDPDVQKWLPAPGFPTTLYDTNDWERIFKKLLAEEVLVTPSENKNEFLTLLKYKNTIFGTSGRKLSQSQQKEVKQVLPFLDQIFHYRQQHQHMQVELTQAQKSLVEINLFRDKLDVTRKELQRALFRTRTEMELIKRTQEYKNQVQSLTIQQQDLIKLNQAKDEFIALASHQLRTPATAVKQYLALMLQGYAGPVHEDQANYLQTAYESNERQLNIINDLLKTAQIDSDRYNLDVSVNDIIEILKVAIEDIIPVASIKNQQIIFEADCERLRMLFDKTEIKLVFANLLENASKYSHPNTSIYVRQIVHEGYIEIIFEDEGIGIPPEQLDAIFDKFTRIENELSGAVIGTGLGLYWVKQIVELHGGNVCVKSTEGKGSQFIIKLPV